MSTARQTHDHQAIKDWVSERNAVPAKIKDSAHYPAGELLRIHFPKNRSVNHDLEEIEWDDFFENFEEHNLDLILQDKKESGEISSFHRFVRRG